MTDEADGPKVVDLPKRDEFRAAMEAVNRALPLMLEHVAMQSKIRRVAYLALMKEGFTEAQSLDLCWRA